jgi:hypothetical protein
MDMEDDQGARNGGRLGHMSSTLEMLMIAFVAIAATIVLVRIFGPI